jgi:transcriptional regulator with XRE-family HTH domain
MTQKELADKCDIFRTYLSRIEGGTANPSIVVLATIAFHLKVGLPELLMDSEGDQ